MLGQWQQTQRQQNGSAAMQIKPGVLVSTTGKGYQLHLVLEWDYCPATMPTY